MIRRRRFGLVSRSARGQLYRAVAEAPSWLAVLPTRLFTTVAVKGRILAEAAIRPCMPRVLATSLIAFALGSPVLAQSATARRFGVDDLLRLRGIGAVVPSPDGRRIAIVVYRPRAGHEHYPAPWLEGGARGDIWIAPTDGGPARQLADGSKRGTGYWDPVWSPNGARLAMLSTPDGDAVHAMVWSVRDSAPVLVGRRSVDLWVSDATTGIPFQPLAWVGDTTLLVPLLPPGAPPRYDPINEGDRLAAREWVLLRRGTVATASVLTSVPGAVPSYMSHEDLVRFDVRSHRGVTLATIPRDPTTSGRRAMMVDPTGRTVAVMTTELEPPSPRHRLTRSMSPFHLGLVDLVRRTPVRWVGAYLSDYGEHDDPPVLRWAPDGRALIAVGVPATGSTPAACAWLIDARSGTTRPLRQPDAARSPDDRAGTWRCFDAAWRGATTPVLLAGSAVGRRDWWIFPKSGTARELGIDDALPPDLMARSRSFDASHERVARAEWAMSGDTTSVALLRRLWPRDSARVAWTTPADGASSSGHDAIIAVREPRGEVLYHVDLTRALAGPERLGALGAGWMVEGYIPAVHAAVVVLRDRAVALVGPGGSHEILRINRWADEFAPPKKLFFRYRALDGDTLGAIALLPLSYTPGRRYPVVTWVYAGMTYEDTTQVRAGAFASSPLNLFILAADGYVVLYPSMPLPPTTVRGSDVLPWLTNGVLPAVDRLVSLGIADSARVAVVGQSFGGYSTLGLITQTHRFRTAIALAVQSDFASWYGTFRPWDRYRGDAQVTLANPKMAEAGQMRMGVPPWSDPARYIRNSPVFFADRVTTPVMIMQGDQDPAGPEQAEEFFTAMYRLGKRAELVRYDGEGHVIESPPNVRDMWQRIEQWLASTMGTDTSAAIGGADGDSSP